MYLELVNTHKSNGNKRIIKCDYGYFLATGKWEAIVINFRPIKKTLWIYRKNIYKNEWPCSCA